MALCKPSIYRHVQAADSASWVITHNLGYNGSTGLPVVDVFVTIDGAVTKILPMEVTVTSANIVTLTFAEARSGEAVIIV